LEITGNSRQNLADKGRGSQIYGVERSDRMIILMLVVILFLLRKRRTKLKFDLEL
jgi:hypothetical protein